MERYRVSVWCMVDQVGPSLVSMGEKFSEAEADEILDQLKGHHCTMCTWKSVVQVKETSEDTNEDDS